MEPRHPTIKSNIAYNVVNKVSAVLFPMITLPYVTRVLGADGIGTAQFLKSVVDYIALCVTIGIPLYAVREIARVRDHAETRDRNTAEILLLHCVLTVLGYLAVILIALYVDRVNRNVFLFLVTSSTLLFNAIGVEWFYQAVEDFRYITLRALAIRILSFISLFIFVRDQNDVPAFVMIMVIGSVGGNILNFIRLRRYISITHIRRLRPFSHFKKSLKPFILNIIISLYTSLNLLMLGFMTDDEAVGYYSVCSHITLASLTVVTAIGASVLPRMSGFAYHQDIAAFRSLASKSIHLTIGLTLPITAGIALLAGPVIRVFCGSGFDPSIAMLQFMSPVVIALGLSGLTGMQILYPKGEESKVIAATLTGAGVNILLNILLIPRYQAYGAALSTLIAETLVFVMLIILGRNTLRGLCQWDTVRKYLWPTIAVYAILTACVHLIDNDILCILTATALSVAVYYTLLLYFKDEFAIRIHHMITRSHD